MAGQTAHIAIRSCKACRARKPKSELQRWALGSDGVPELDKNSNLDGRGAYVCSEDCYNNIHKRLGRMLIRRPKKSNG